MKEHPDYSWDHHSDQPHMMKDKALKRALYRRSWFQFLKANLLLIFLPLFLLIQAFRKKTTHSEKPGQCLGLSIHLETEAEGKTIVSDHGLMSMVITEESGLSITLNNIKASSKK